MLGLSGDLSRFFFDGCSGQVLSLRLYSLLMLFLYQFPRGTQVVHLDRSALWIDFAFLFSACFRMTFNVPCISSLMFGGSSYVSFPAIFLTTHLPLLINVNTSFCTFSLAFHNSISHIESRILLIYCSRFWMSAQDSLKFILGDWSLFCTLSIEVKISS